VSTIEDGPVSLADLFKKHGKRVMPLDSELLLKRVAQGGDSGRFLADAFISAYRTGKIFTHGLFELFLFDDECQALFNQIIHIRPKLGWNEKELYRIEQQILAILDGDLVIPGVDRLT
jgi:hypothetical protein